MTLQELTILFLNNRRVYCSEKTLIYYSENLRRFIDFCLSKNISSSAQLNQKLLEDYILELTSSGVSNVSIRTYMRAVKAFINFICENDYISDNIMKHIKLPKADPVPVLPLSIQDVNIIDNYINTMNMSLRNYLIFHLMLDSGLRSGEVVRLKLCDVITSSKMIRIYRSKGNKSRYVPVPNKLMSELEFYISHTHKTKNKDINVFLLEDGELINSEAVKRICSKIKKMTGIDRFHAHLCRHTFATSYLMGGGNMESLRILTGHEDYDVLKGYLHIAKSMELMNFNIYRLDEVYFRQFNYRI